MRNFVREGDSVSVTAPYAVTSGQGVLVGAALFGIAITDAANGATLEIACEGVFLVTKEPALAIAVGARLFWDNTNRRLTTTLTSNICVGVATAAALAADTVVAIRLQPIVAVGA